MNQYSTPIKYGFISGLACIIIQTIIYLIAPAKVSTQLYFLLVYVPILFCMVLGGITHRKEMGGSLTFINSLASVFIIAIIGVTLVNVFTYRILMTIIDSNLIGIIKDGALRKLNDVADKKGLSDEMIEKATEGINLLTVAYLEQAAWIVSSACSVLLSLIVAAFVSRPEQKPMIKPTE